MDVLVAAHIMCTSKHALVPASPAVQVQEVVAQEAQACHLLKAWVGQESVQTIR